MKKRNPIRSVARLFPAFAIISIAGCLLAYYCQVPQERLATVVSVPLIVSFLLTRLGVLVVPHTKLTDDDRKAAAEVPIFGKVTVLLLLIACFAATIAILSAVVYSGIGLKESAIHAVRLFEGASMFAFGACFALVMFAAALAFKANALKIIANAEIALFWRVARTPGLLGALILGHLEKHG